jgi:hypothetical protein
VKNRRISSRDLEKLQKRAVMEGIPYQTLIASTLHKFVTGKLKEVIYPWCSTASPRFALIGRVKETTAVFALSRATPEFDREDNSRNS